jgi:hypothetical protein
LWHYGQHASLPGMTEIRDQRVPVLLTASELERLDDWMFGQRLRSRGEAIRRLMELGFQAYERSTKSAKQKKGDD